MKKRIINLIFKIMKNRRLKIIISLVIAMVASCDEPETVVTNIVHPDGSVTRKIEMKNAKNKFDVTVMQVPFDSTWTIRDSLEISNNGKDTVWVKRAEKLFASVDEINGYYKADSGANKKSVRRAEFRKKFKWFNTEYDFSETIDKKMLYGYPVSNFLNQDELKWFYSPDNFQEEKKNGPDSLKFKAFSDTTDKKAEKWMIKCLVSEWIGEFTKLTGEKAVGSMSQESLKQREDEFAKIVIGSGEHFDSLWSNGDLLKEFVGEADAARYKVEADSAGNIASERLFRSFARYTMRTIMPGKLTDTNGLIDSSGVLLWPVKDDYFLTEPYVMRAESKVPNRWAWIVSGLFLVFVIMGFIIRKKGKG
jgi:hypothetical protein